MYAACAVLVAVLGWHALGNRGAPTPITMGPASSRSSAVSVRPAAARSATVDVVGAVNRPGVYRFHDGQRVEDAIQRAGGARPHADLEAINLAAKLADAEQIVVPRKASQATMAAAAAGPAASAASGAPPQAPIHLNSATAEQLDTLDGVGPVTAQKIVEYRAQHGGFSSVDDLGQISGIGPKRLQSLRTQVQL